MYFIYFISVCLKNKAMKSEKVFTIDIYLQNIMMMIKIGKGWQTNMSEHTRDGKKRQITVLEVGRTWGRQILVFRRSRRTRDGSRGHGRRRGRILRPVSTCLVPLPLPFTLPSVTALLRGNIALFRLLVGMGVVIGEAGACFVASTAYCNPTTSPTLLAFRMDSREQHA